MLDQAANEEAVDEQAAPPASSAGPVDASEHVAVLTDTPSADGGELDRLRTEGVRAVAHRARTPLSLVVGAISSAVHHGDLGDQVRAELELAAAQAERICGDMEELCELGTWSHRLHPTPLRIGALFEAVGLRLLAGSYWRGISYQVTSFDTREVLADERTTTWMVEVLVRNAIEIAGERGRVELNCVDHEDDSVLGTFVVSDADVGAQGDVDEIRLAATAAALHGGTITRRAQAGTVTFTLELPASQPSGAADSAVDNSWRSPPSDPTLALPADRTDEPTSEHVSVSEPTGPDGAPLVLLVEDDVSLRNFWARELSADYRVVVAGTAEEAADLIAQFEPDVIACDLILPGRSGEQMINDLHAAPVLDDIPVIVFTGDSDEERRTRLLRDGADDYLVKPFAVGELNARIANLVQAHLNLDNLKDRAERAQQLASQLQTALDTRVVIEQAKAFVAADREIDVDEAFEVLRRHARSHNLKLHEVASKVIDGYRP